MASLKSLWQPFIKTERPNIRTMFVPDPGYILVEVDLKQADAQIVAWESGKVQWELELADAAKAGRAPREEKLLTRLMKIFEEINNGADRDVHKENAYICFNTKEVTPWQRQISKHVVHGTNFIGSAREVARRLGLLQHQVQVFQSRWFQLNPEIKLWHTAIENELMQTRSVKNILGYSRMFFDRIDQILPEAVAWKPQSTTALVINAGIRNVERELPVMELLMQVHDSALWQVPCVSWNAALKKKLKQCMTIRLPYPRPLEMLVELKTSKKSWGDVEKEKWQ